MSGAIGTTSSGSVFIGGTSSGINTTALIDAAVAQKTRRADILQVEIDKNSAKIGAYDELTTLTSAIDTALGRLRGPESQFDDTERVFDLRSGTISVSDGSSFAGYANIAVDSSATEGSYDIEIIQEARVHKVQSGNVADNTAALGFTGTFDIGLTSGGALATVSISAGDSLQDLAAAINLQVDTTGVKANVVKVSETSYVLVLEGKEFNRGVSIQNVSGDDVLAAINLSDGAGGFVNPIQAERGAEITVDGVTITRDDNNFDDVIVGLDIDVKAGTAGAIISLDVTNDTLSVKEAIEDFITAYNAFRDFVTQNQQVDASGNVGEDALLFSDNLLNGLTDKYSGILSLNFGNGGNIQTIRDLGITIGNGNKLSITDPAKLDTALIDNFDEVKAAFASGSTSDNVEFRLTGNTSFAGSQSIVFDLTTDGAGTITSVSANGDGSAFTISGNTITGASGSAFAGLTFTYVGTAANVTINADLNQGLADKIINGTNGYTDTVTGLIIREKANLQSENQDKSQDVVDILKRAEDFRQSQIDKYAKLEANSTRLNLLLDQIRAILGSDDDD